MMFDPKEKKKTQMVKAVETTSTVIGQGVSIDGQSFKGVGQVRIDGIYSGEMYVNGNVIIGQSGEVRGNISATSMTVAGTVSGNIICREELHVTETAVTEGDIQTHSIVVDEGAVINGTIATGQKDFVEPINLDAAIKNMDKGGAKLMDGKKDVPAIADNSKKATDSVG